MIRRRVDFPQPDGPSSDRNSPSCTASETSRRICVLPKDFEIRSIVRSAMGRDPGLKQPKLSRQILLPCHDGLPNRIGKNRQKPFRRLKPV